MGYTIRRLVIMLTDEEIDEVLEELRTDNN